MPYQRCLNSNIPENAQHFLYDVTNSFVLPLDTLLALLSVVFNSVSLVAILRTRTIQRPSLLLLCGLSMTDVTWAITSLIDNTLSFSLKYSCPKEMKGAGESFAFTLCFFSILGYLAVISFDRLLAVWKPWWYRNNVTRSHAIRQMSFVWMLSAILSGIRAAKWYFPSVQSIFRFLSFLIFSMHLDYSLLLLWSIDCKCPSQSGYESIRKTYAHRPKAREENSKHSFVDPCSAVFHFSSHTDCFFCISLAGILRR